MKRTSFNFSALVAFSVMLVSSLGAQCPTNLLFEGQLQIDDFASTYPDCVTQGWVENITIVRGNADGMIVQVTDLSPLSSITSIRGIFTMTDAMIDDFTSWNTLDSIGLLRLNGDAATIDSMSSLAGLEGLSYLSEIDLSLPIVNIDAISSLPVDRISLRSTFLREISGFNTATTMGKIFIFGNPRLESITGFQNLTEVPNGINITNSDLLSDMSGFGNVEIVGAAGGFASALQIDNTALTDLSDFASLRISDRFIIQNNSLLTDISQLNQVDLINTLSVTNNPQLSDCCVIGLLTSTGQVNSLTLFSNNTNCNSLIDLAINCPDGDDDGVIDSEDNCPNSANPGQEDFDSDGVGDGCDNCPRVANPDQTDMNENGIGDACDMGQEVIGLSNELGDLYSANGLILKSIDGSCYKIIVTNGGVLEAHGVQCP